RDEADAIRAKAGAVLERARAEAVALARRRDEIAEELSGLSGVIDALAVPAEDEPTPPSPGPIRHPTLTITQRKNTHD
ncbi:MAG: hypothetical protein H0W95_02615, partial [Nocardioidaceae bacterium]|nr:hypothetical protein [Nocardioidaceae bacterium]